MNMRMLIDARHREETRVAVVKGNRIEEFDFESAEHKQLKGNIYLAKVTRVEPSLQAAFVDYGGNRHGFLAFSEIHPDYYQIPREDREALLREEAEHAAEEAALRDGVDDDIHGDDEDADHSDHVEEVTPVAGDEPEAEAGSEAAADSQPPRKGRGGKSTQAEDSADELRRKRMSLRRRYKIQDVIKRRQVLLIQVVKEERGNKGAALTTYLSLAGRYCVLMPNTSHGGGISRKISNVADRKRLKSIIAEMNLPSTMGCIVRTAGLQRTRTEIKRDFDYLARLWDEIRENTLKSAAPALIHNDSDLIKRAIRDIYNRDIDEVVVEGEDGYRQAKDFMKLLMPSHARRVKPYADPVSLFQRYGAEDQLPAMYHPVVQLKSGGYLVINPTEALVSIDINSGRSTREHNIEQTATATNLEAAREIARQLRLRDMAGLVVIDFIDMEHGSNVRKVEKAMKDALKDDRARIQVGRISGFGLMEMSRQRLRTGVLEASTRACPHCEGTGLVRTASSAGLSALRMLEEEAARGRGSLITLRASQEAAFYVLNNKRREIDEIEQRYGVVINILPDGEIEGARMSVEASGPKPTQVVEYAPITDDDDADLPIEDMDEEEEFEAESDEDERVGAERGGEDRDGRRKRRRRRRRGGRGEEGEAMRSVDGASAEQASSESEDAGTDAEYSATDDGAAEEGESRRRGRRGRRGGRRRRGGAGGETEMNDGVADTRNAEDGAEKGDENAEASPAPVADSAAEAGADAPVENAEEAAPKARRRPRARKAATAKDEAEQAVTEAPAQPEAVAEAEPAEKPKPKRTRKKKTDTEADTDAKSAGVETPAPEAESAPAKPRRARKKKVDAEAPAATVDAPVAEAAPTQTPAPAPASTPAKASANDGGDGAISVTASAATDDDGQNEDGSPRRGWWQRTFGA